MIHKGEVQIGNSGRFALGGTVPSERSKNMTSPHSKNRIAVCATKLLVKFMFSAILCVGSAVCAPAQDAQPDKPDTWTATTQTSAGYTNPSRTTESHAKSGNRSVDKQRVEVLGPNGRYQPDR